MPSALSGVRHHVLAPATRATSGEELAKYKKNLFGFKTYDSSPFESARQYDTFGASIEDFCRLISREYLNPARKYYSAPTILSVGLKYATDPKWAEKVLAHCSGILRGCGKCLTMP